MKVFILSDPNSIHTKRWISSLSVRGIEIFLFGISNYQDDYYSQYKNVAVYSADYTTASEGTSFKKLRYLGVLNILRKKINSFRPDILHAHYASSYGLLGALTRFTPYIISIWGSDIYEFPKISFLHKSLLRYSLSKADFILSTSRIMVAETKKYTKKSIEVTPFGVDLNLFRKIDLPKQDNEFIVGSVKTLSANYGMDILIKSFKQVINKNPDLNLKLQIIGSGPDRQKLHLLAKSLGIETRVMFLGKLENTTLPVYYNSFSVFVSISNLESFGVVAVEAMACECPVIVSDADGYTEVVQNEETGLIVPKGDIDATAHAIQRFINDRSLRDTMGIRGRKRVEKYYNWNENVEKMINIYNSMISIR